MHYQAASSTSTDSATAVRELVSGLAAVPDPSLVLCFASPSHPTDVVARELAAAFPRARTVGCTTAGEITTGRMLQGSLVALAVSRFAIPTAAVAIARELRGGARDAVRRAAGELEAGLGRPLAELEIDRHLGLVLVDGLSRAEESLMDALGDLTNVRFVGGSAGDDLAFEGTRVFADGTVASDAAVLFACRPAVRFEIVKTQSFLPRGRALRVTRCDAASRRVVELDGQPAAVAYAAALEVPVATLAEHFMENPLGLMMGEEPFVRSPQRVDGTDVVFYCNVREGQELQVLQAGDIVGTTRAALDELRRGFGPVGALIDFHCILRTIELRARNATGAYGALSAGVPCVGFSTYGEQYVGHINQTSTMVALAPA